MTQGAMTDCPCSKCVAIAPPMYAARSKVPSTPVLGMMNKITEMQTEKYGHNPTPEFEHKLAENEREGNSKTKVFENNFIQS